MDVTHHGIADPDDLLLDGGVAVQLLSEVEHRRLGGVVRWGGVVEGIWGKTSL